MNKKAKFLVSLLSVLFITSSLGSSVYAMGDPGIDTAAGTGAKLSVYAASSLTEPLNDIAKLYLKSAPQTTIKFTFGGSGNLQHQVEQGATADLFISAAAAQMDSLSQKGLVDTDTVTNLLSNQVVLIAPADSNTGITSFQDCGTSKVRSVAIGNPKTVPAGQYAQEVFKSLGIWDKVSSKAVYGSDVKQVLSLVATGKANCGVVYVTDAKMNLNVKTVAEAPSGSHTPIVYPAAVLKTSNHHKQAYEFLSFLKSDAATQIFAYYGFRLYK